MSPVQNVWRQLVQRRLWPVAILLVAALVAVPVMLAKDPAPQPAPPAPAAETGDNELATQPIVAMATAEDRADRRRVLGEEKNPFKRPKVKSADETSPGGDAAQGDTAQPDTSTPDSGGTTPGPVTPGPGTPTDPATPAPKPKTYARHELTVRFGLADGIERQSLKQLDALPSEAPVPVLIYTGVIDGGKTAVFLLDDGVSAVGDGDCFPSPDSCESIYLKAGETMFLDRADATGVVVEQYQLDVLKIHKGTSDSASASKSKAKKAKAKVARAALMSTATGRSGLRGTVARISAYLP